MPRSWTRAHPKSVTSVGSVLLAIAAAGLTAATVGAVAVQARSFGPLVVVCAVVAATVLVLAIPTLWTMARAGRLGAVRPAGGVGDQDAVPVADAEPSSEAAGRDNGRHRRQPPAG